MATSFPITADTVCASAPGKVILFGEHAVVYGHPAIAAALTDLRIFVWITPIYTTKDTDAAALRIQLPDLPTPVDYTLPKNWQDDIPEDWPVPPEPNATAAKIAAYLSEQSTLDEFSIAAVTPILYLVRTLMTQNTRDATTQQNQQQPGYHIYVRSQDLPVGAGLGSSAAFSVALAAALLQTKQLDSSRSDNSKNSSKRVSPSLDTVNEVAYHAEILLHGHPSGLDNAVATYGGALQFTKNLDQGSIELQPLEHFSQIDMLLVHTHIPRSTKALVAGVRALQTKYPTVVNPILQSMGEIAAAFGQGKCVSQQALLDWVRLNHCLLRTVGVSHPSLDALVQIVSECGNAAAKLTGAGGGGCALVVWSDEESHQQVSQRLQQQTQYTCFSSTVGGQGVQWHEDAVAVWKEASRGNSRTNSNQRWKNVLAGASLVTAMVAVTVLVRRQR
eukprot:scaffold3471_cov175-Amphora_coffeaeformis.AAC.13